MTVAVCLKWVVSGNGDERFAELSYADQAALECALLTGAHYGQPVRAVTAGPVEADKILRQAVAVGVDEVYRIDLDSTSSSALVAHNLSLVLGDCHLIWCGDYSSDRGSGSVPAFLAGELNVGQALGLIDVEIPLSAADPLQVRRRLDGGRRELLAVQGSAVLSVEGSVARLRRAPLRATMAAANASITTITSTAQDRLAIDAIPNVRPFRPRPRPIAAPIGLSALDRVRQVTDIAKGSERSRSEVVELEPKEAAERILASLRAWNYLDS